MKEDDPKDAIKSIEKDIENGGERTEENTFAILPGEEHVVFIINNVPGREGKALGMQLPPEMAHQLGSALIACAKAVVTGIELEEEEEKVTLH